MGFDGCFMKVSRIWFLFLMVLVLQSCALLLNRPNKKVMVYTSTDQKVVYKKDTLATHQGTTVLIVPRAKEPIQLTVINDSAAHQVLVLSKPSLAFWSNIFFNNGIGMIADAFTPKRFTYPANVPLYGLASDTVISKGVLFQSEIKSPQYKPKEAVHLLKVSPQRMMNFLQPGLELSYEVRNNRSFSTQFTAAIMAPKGYRGALEQKFYFEQRAPFGVYISLGVDFQANRFERVNSYVDKSLIPDSLDYKDYYHYVDSLSYRDSITIRREIFNLNWKVGIQGQKGQLCYDLYFGLGYRYRSVVYEGRINPLHQVPDPDSRHPNFFDVLYEGSYPLMNITAGFRIGYVFPYRERAVVEDNFD